MEHMESKPKMTHMVAYSYVAASEIGWGSIDVSLPDGFSGPEVRVAIQDAIMRVNPRFISANVTNVIRYGSL